MSWTRSVRKALAKFGYQISRVQGGIGGDAFFDMARLVSVNDPLVFDVGANVGQTIANLRSTFPKARIHSFEPSPASFEILKKNVSHYSNVQIWNCGLGSSCGQKTLLENKLSEWTSFLPPSEFGWGAVEKETPVRMLTIDEFCRENAVDNIDILKSDTQGYDFEVFRGAEQMFRKGAIGIVYCEVIFSDMYKDIPSFGQMYDFLIDRDFRLVSFYDVAYDKGLASWADGVFVHKGYGHQHL
jgi:FkbM family methyltransferase